MAAMLALARRLIVKLASEFCENALKIAFLAREQSSAEREKTLISGEICVNLRFALGVGMNFYPWLLCP
jgi:hypothetical protein